MSEFYYGLPQSIWDNLCSKTEDLLYENKIGQHIVGLYPAGNRIFGEESSSPGLLCLYMDSVDSLIDPLNFYSEQQHYHELVVGNSMSPIVFIDIFMWVYWHFKMAGMPYLKSCILRKNFTHMIPFGKHMIYEDQSVSAIIDAVADFSIKGSYYPHVHQYDNLKTQLKLNRTEAIIAQQKIFAPCNNPEWDEQIILDQEKERQLTGNNLNNFYKDIIKSNQTDKGIDMKKVEKVQKMVMDLYRFQL